MCLGQVDVGLNELTKRADRIKLLGQQRDELAERLTHMDLQVQCTVQVYVWGVYDMYIS